MSESETLTSLWARACQVMGREAATAAYECGRLRTRIMLAAQRILAVGTADAETIAWIQEGRLAETGGRFTTVAEGRAIHARLTQVIGPEPRS